MGEYAFFEYRAKLENTLHTEQEGELIHCLIKMEIGSSRDEPVRERLELEREAEELVLFALNPGPRRRISHSAISEVDEERLRELGPATDFHLVESAEIHFYSS